MRDPRFTLRAAEVVAGVGFLLFGLFIMWESFKLGPGWGGSGPRPGFFPFWLSALMALGGVAAVLELAFTLRKPQLFFEDPQEIVDLIKVGIPIVLVVLSISYLGLYIVAAVYLGLFAWWYGGLRWYLTIPGGAAFSYILYLVLDQGFRIMMPKSLWYGDMLPF